MRRCVAVLRTFTSVNSWIRNTATRGIVNSITRLIFSLHSSLHLGVYPGQCRGMWPRAEDHSGAEASLSTHFPLLHSQRCAQWARLSLPRCGDITTPRQCWRHLYAAHKGKLRQKCHTVKKGDILLKYFSHTYRFLLSACSLICSSGWMKRILCFRSEPVYWSWSTELFASAAETPSLNFSRPFTSLPNTGPGFYVTISLITTVTACGCSWLVSVCVCVCVCVCLCLCVSVYKGSLTEFNV